MFGAYSRAAYIIVLPVSLCAVLVAWLLSDSAGMPLVVMAYTVCLLLILHLNGNRQLLNLTEILIHSIIALVFFAYFHDIFHANYDRSVIAGKVLASSGWVLVVSMLTLFVSRLRYSMLWSAGYYLMFAGFGVSRVIVDINAGITGAIHQPLLQMLLATGALLLLMFVVALVQRRFEHVSTQVALLQERANTDYLTGLPNRRKMTSLVEQALERAQRYSQPFSIILFDIDHFKNVNDNHGHDIGDDVLRRIATIVAHNIRRVDRVGRWGGEEFLILAPEADLAHATQYARRLKHLIAEYDHDPAGTVTASFGIAAYGAGDTLYDILKRCDRALYHAKEQGRNRVVAAQSQHEDPVDVAGEFTVTLGGWAPSSVHERSSTSTEP